MTGYGEAFRETEAFSLEIELRSVNNRFLRVVAKLADELAYLLAPLEKRIASRIQRGSVYLTVRFTPARREDLYDVDDALVRKYLESLETLRDELGRTDEICLVDVLQLPGVIATAESFVPERDEPLPVALEALDEAIDGLVAMREQEGRHLQAELRERTRGMRAVLDQVIEDTPAAIQEHHQRLDQRVRQLLGDRQAALAPEDVLKEMAIIAERSDMTEETARVASHLEQFGTLLDANGAVGRKLEFIVQEMFRESNTMGSKSTSPRLSEQIVLLKADVERLKEQVANIE